MPLNNPALIPRQQAWLLMSPLLNGWRSLGNGFSPGRYWRDSFGSVHLEGVFQHPDININGLPLFILPAGYRPEVILLVGCYSDGRQTISPGRVSIKPNGEITPETGGTLRFSIDNISSFRAFQ